MKTATVSLSLNIEAFRKGISEAIAAAKKLVNPEVKVGVDTSEVDGLAKKLDAFKGGLIGGALSGIAANVVGNVQQAFGAAVEAGLNYEKALQSVSAVTGVTGAGLDDLSTRAQDLALQFGGSATTQLEAFQTVLSKFGPDLAKTPEALGTVSESVNLLAKAAGLDAKQSVDALSNSMLQFGVDASDPAKLAAESGRFINVLAASAKVGAAEIPQVADAILQAGVAAKGANLSFEETNAAIQQLAVGGKVGSEAGVSLRNVIGLLTKQSGPGEKALAGVGLSIKDLGETLTKEGLAPALEKLRGGIDKLGSDAEKAAFKATLFGTENAAAAGILLGGIDNIKSFTEGVTGTSEALTQAAINSDTIGARFEKLKAAVEVGLIQAFQKLSPIVKAIFDNFSEFAPILGIIAAGAIAYGVAIGVQTLATKLATIAAYDFAAALAANPIGATIAAVTLLAVGIYALADALSVSAEEALDNANAEKELVQQQIASNKERKQSVTQTKTLTQEFEELAKKTNRTAEEDKRLRDIQSQLDKQYPDLIDQTKSFADNLKGVQQISKLATAELGKLGEEGELLAKRLEQSTRNVAFATRNVALEAFREAADDADVEKAGDEFVNAIFGARSREDIFKAQSAFLDKLHKARKQNIMDDEEFLATEKALTEAVNKSLDTFKAATPAVEENSEAKKDNTDNTDDNSDANDEAADKAKKYAEELAKARRSLEELNAEQAKQRELAAADLIADDTEREKKRAEIENRFAVAALERAKKYLTSEREVRTLENEAINAKIVAANEKYQQKLGDIEGKAAADRFKLLRETERRNADVQQDLLEGRLQSLETALKNGNTQIVGEVFSAQRAVIDGALSETVAKIVESTPEFAAAIKQINFELANNLLTPDEAAKRATLLRQEITQRLLSLPRDTTDAFAQQIFLAYDKASRDIAKATGDIADSAREAFDENRVTSFAESLRGVGDAVREIDYAAIFRNANREAEDLAKQEGELLEAVQSGETTYQDALAKYSELDTAREASSSTTVAVVAATLQAIAQQQLDAANESIAKAEEFRARNEEIAAELVEIEKQKNAALAQLREEDAVARLEVEQRFAAQQKALQDEQTKNTEGAATAQETALAQIGAAAGTAFAGLLTGAQSAKEALKEIVGATVKSLIKLYTPAILAAFQTIIPGPLGIVAGSAAIATLNALVSAALAGFKDGGYTGNVGVNEIAGVVHGQEMVINANATRKHRTLLESINAGKPLPLNSAMPITELQMMRSELTAIRQRLDRVPDMTQRREAVDVSLGLDPVLYERGRHRMMARSLRG